MIRRALEAVILIFSLAASIEAGVQLWHRYQYGTWYTPVATANRFATSIGWDPSKDLRVLDHKINLQVVHPYVGFVSNSLNLSEDGASYDRDRTVRTFGYPFNDNPVPFTTASGQVNILVTGGSVAEALGIGGYLEAAYERNVRDPRPKPYFFTAAMGGYKQPQQALALAFFSSVGAKFDLVINIDGYNEVVLPYFENYRAGTYPFFPRAWRNRIGGRGSGSKLVGEMLYLDSRKESLTRSLRRGGIYHSAIVGLYALWQLDKISGRITELSKIASIDAAAFEQSGPYMSGFSREEIVAQSVDVWARSSKLMQHLASGAGIEYFHVLQPNQYVENSKIFTEQEKALYVSHSPVAEDTTVGYRALIARGKELRLPNYIDTTDIFLGEPRTVYADSCCHFNQLGYELLADTIMRKVAARSSVLRR
jgi:hypothetical protein